MRNIFFGLILMTFLSSSHVHDFHVSKLDIHLNPTTKSFECTLHLFTDDMEDAIKKSGVRIKNKSGVSKGELNDDEVSDYIFQKINIKLDGKAVTLRYVGKEEAESFDAIYIYFEAEKIRSFKTLEIKHQLFHEIFDDQKNIVSFTVDKKLKEFFIMEKDKITHTIHF